MAKKKNVISTGKRKTSIARAVIKQGKGDTFVNGRPVSDVWSRYKVMRLNEPFMISGSPKDIDIFVNVKGGGNWGQVDASRTAIGNALVKHYGTKNKTLKSKLLNYDRSIMISDSRRTEAHKPSRSSAGPRRTKQQSKR
ncbi:30S ribosomal protein S9 [archaeon]|nr:30S ribosomal protein S9 [archaeon]